VLVGYSRIS